MRPAALPLFAAPFGWRLSLAALRAAQWWYFVPIVAASAQTPASLALSAAAASGCLAFAYGLNALTDRDADASAGKNPLIGKPVPRALWPLLALCAALGIAFGGAAAAVSLAAGLLYSAGPRLKSIPFAGTITNAAIFTPLLYLGTGPVPPALAVALAALIIENQLVHELADLDEDTRAGVRTTARLIGQGPSLALAAGVGAAAAVTLVSLGSAAAAGLVAAGGLLAALIGVRAPRTARIGHRCYAIAAGALLFALERWR